MTVVGAQIKAEADDILFRRGLLEIVRQYGAGFVGGSYSYDLMCWRDLDIYLLAPNITVASFFELGGRVSERFAAQKSFFTNNRGGSPNGLYWGVRLGDPRAGAWKFDIWGLDAADFQKHVDYAQDLRSRLTPEARETILAIKSQLWQSAEYRDNITSCQLYKAVLEHGVKTSDEFRRHIKSH